MYIRYKFLFRRVSHVFATAVCEFRNLTENLVICLRLFIEFYNNAPLRLAATATETANSVGFDAPERDR